MQADVQSLHDLDRAFAEQFGLGSVETGPKRKTRRSGVIFYAVLIAIVAGVIGFSGSGEGPRQIFGYSTLTILTGSMQRELPQGSLVLVKQVDPNTIEVGDNVTYMFSESTSVTHKVVGIIESYRDGQRGFETRGVENSASDKELVPAANVVGKVIYHMPRAGAAAQWAGDHILLIAIVLFGIGGLLILLCKTIRFMLKPNPNLNKAVAL